MSEHGGKTRVNLKLEVLDERALPSVLIVKPPSAVDLGPSEIFSLSSSPNVGLTNAQHHTDGVVSWVPGT